MSKKAKVIVLFLVVLIIGVVAFLCSTYAKSLNTTQSTSNINEMNVPASNVEYNVVQDNKVKEDKPVEEPVINENVRVEEEPKESEPIVDDVPQTEDSELQADSDEEKAIAIVKKDWGDTSGVAFRVEQINGDGSYVISVRNEDSIAMDWYTVYPKKGTFTK